MLMIALSLSIGSVGGTLTARDETYQISLPELIQFVASFSSNDYGDLSMAIKEMN